MRKVWFAVGTVVLLTATGCRPDTVNLAYRFPEGSTLTYEMVSSVQANWDIGGEGEGSYEVAFDVTEEIQSVDEDGAVVSLDLTRTSVEEDNYTPPSDTSFTVRVDEHGAVLEVIEVDGVAGSLLEPEERSLILTYRPLVALDPVRLHEEWDARQQFEGSEFQQLKLVGRLEKLDRDENGDFATLSYTGSGPLIGTSEVPQGEAELSGSTETSGTAVIDLEEGLLRTATSSTDYDFEVDVIPEEASTPLSGTLNIHEDLQLTRIEQTS